MAQLANSDSEDDFHSASQHAVASENEMHDSDSIAEDMDDAPSVHPIPSFQDAFQESIREAADDDGSPDDSTPDIEGDAEMRRRRLLEADRYEDVAATRWKQKPGAKYHPFVKLMAQIVFGMHLLQQEQAKSNEAVVKILQNHVNDVDNFLERTSDDFDLAITDIEERIRYLQLPMQHMDIFEVMLDEKKFRTDLLSGNEKIEKIIGRTGKSMQDAMVDIQSGIKCTQELHQYLATIEKKGPIGNKDIAEVFSAMRGNQQGWMKFLSDLQTKGNNLSNELVSLGNVIAEIARLAGEASRRNKPQVHQRSSSISAPSSRTSVLQSKYTKDMKGSVLYKKPGPWLDKPLPQEPGTVGDTVEVAMPKPHPVPFSTRFEQPRRLAPVPGARSASSPMSRSPAPQRPRTSGSMEPRAMRRVSRDELAMFRKHSNPLRSHPPDTEGYIMQSPPRRLGHTQSRSSGDMLGGKKKSSLLSKRSKSSGNVAGSMSPTTPTSRKVVGFDQSRESPRFNPMPKKGSDVEALPSITTGFSRRLSVKLKNLPGPTKSQPKPEPVVAAKPPFQPEPVAVTKSQPKPEPVVAPKSIDSTNSSERDRKRSTSSPTNFTTDTEQTEYETAPEPEKALPPIDAKTDANKFSLARDESQPGSRLALFPKVSTPTHSGVPSRNPTPSPSSKAWEAEFESPEKPRFSTMQQPTKTGRTFSVAKFFHRKGGSKSVIASS